MRKFLAALAALVMLGAVTVTPAQANHGGRLADYGVLIDCFHGSSRSMFGGTTFNVGQNYYGLHAGHVNIYNATANTSREKYKLVQRVYRNDDSLVYSLTFYTPWVYNTEAYTLGIGFLSSTLVRKDAVPYSDTQLYYKMPGDTSWRAACNGETKAEGYYYGNFP